MRRTQALSKILKVLENWEGSMLEMRTAKDILQCIENEVKMTPPIWFQDCQEDGYGGQKTGHIIPRTGWEPEPKLKRKSRRKSRRSTK